MESLTLGQVLNRLDAAKQRGEFNPSLPFTALFPEFDRCIPHEDSKATHPKDDIE